MRPILGRMDYLNDLDPTNTSGWLYTTNEGNAKFRGCVEYECTPEYVRAIVCACACACACACVCVCVSVH